MKQIGRVTALKDGMAVVEIRTGDRCRSCTMQQSCRGCEEENAYTAIEAENDAGAKVGDRVAIGSGADKLWKLAALCYLLPIALALAGYGLVWHIFSHGLAAALTAFGLFAMTLLIASARVKKFGNKPLLPRIERIL